MFSVETRTLPGQVTAVGSAGPFTLVVDRPVEAGGGGKGFNGGQLLYLAVAGCISNDLFREATARVPEVATATVQTLRQKLWKVGAVLVTSARRIWLHVSETWPGQALWRRVHEAVVRFVAQQTTAGRAAATG